MGRDRNGHSSSVRLAQSRSCDNDARWAVKRHGDDRPSGARLRRQAGRRRRRALPHPRAWAVCLGKPCRAPSWFRIESPSRRPPHPAVVMAGGWCYVKELIQPEYSQLFIDSGVAVLTFDDRNLGASEGQLRQHINSWEQIYDIVNGVTYVSSRGTAMPNGRRLRRQLRGRACVSGRGARPARQGSLQHRAGARWPVQHAQRDVTPGTVSTMVVGEADAVFAALGASFAAAAARGENRDDRDGFQRLSSFACENRVRLRSARRDADSRVFTFPARWP